jgi:AraC-like DNA-binding protein
LVRWVLDINDDIEFYKSLGVMVSIAAIDRGGLEGLSLSPSHAIHSSAFCSLMKSSAKGLSRCLDCKRRSLAALVEGKRIEGLCAFGLWECAEPILRGKRVVGAVYVGGFLDGSEKSRKTLRRGMTLSSHEVSRAEKCVIVEKNAEELKKVSRHAARALSAIAERALSDFPTLPPPSYSPSVSALVRRAESAVSHSVSLECIALEMGKSAKHLGKCFKREVGMSFSAYIRSMRLARAAELLCRTPLSVLEIALECGFESAEYFTRCFKAHFSLTPSDYRRNNGG